MVNPDKTENLPDNTETLPDSKATFNNKTTCESHYKNEKCVEGKTESGFLRVKVK